MSLLRHLIFGVLFGMTVAFAGIMFRFKKNLKNGMLQNFKNLQKDDYILFYIKELRPYYQTSKFSVSLGFSKFIEKIDQALENPNFFKDQFFILDSMSLLSDHPVQSSDKFTKLTHLKKDMEKLLNDHVK
jgi:hypothetical protein